MPHEVGVFARGRARGRGGAGQRLLSTNAQRTTKKRAVALLSETPLIDKGAVGLSQCPSDYVKQHSRCTLSHTHSIPNRSLQLRMRIRPLNFSTTTLHYRCICKVATTHTRGQSACFTAAGGPGAPLNPPATPPMPLTIDVKLLRRTLLLPEEIGRPPPGAGPS